MQGATENHVSTFTDNATVVVTTTADSDRITVTVIKNVPVLTGITSSILGDSMERTSSCTMRKE